jgi:hypothetical protein
LEEKSMISYSVRYYQAYSGVKNALRQLDYHIASENSQLGIINAVCKSNVKRIIDLKLYSIHSNVKITILAGRFTEDCESIGADPETADRLAGMLAEELRADSGLNSFRLSQDDLLHR